MGDRDSNGGLSVLKKASKEPVTKQDMNIAPGPGYYLPTEIIVDGKTVLKNLSELGNPPIWLSDELRKQGISRVQDILYAEMQSDGSLYI